MKHIYLLQIIAGHQFDDVCDESAYPTRDMAEKAALVLLEAIRRADKEWANCYSFKISEVEFFG